MGRGQAREITVTVRNTGTSTWTRSEFKLGALNDSRGDASRFMTGLRAYLPQGSSVPPGDSYTFRFRIQAPAQEGDLEPAWRMVHEGVRWFGAVARQRVTVTGPPPWQDYPSDPFVIPLRRDVPDGLEGGIIVHDLNGDGLFDYLVSSAATISAYDHDGRMLWETHEALGATGRANGGQGYPGIHHPGLIAGDVDGDGRQEAGWITRGGELLIVDGATGREEKRINARGATAVMIANLRGQGDRDVVFQHDLRRIRGVRIDTGRTLWDTTEFISAEHSPGRVADLDGDGRDEIVGVRIIGPDGRRVGSWDLGRDLGSAQGSVDSVVIADLIRGGPLEAVIAEQGGNNQAIAFNPNRIIFGKYNPANPCCRVAGECREVDPDKIAIGNFVGGEDRLEIFCRSACGRAPWVLDADGNIIATWVVDDEKPQGWYVAGIEEVVGLDWDGDGTSKILAKERHVDGDAAVINAMTGRFVRVFRGQAVRVYAADVAGDAREEVITVDRDGTIKVYANQAVNRNAPRPRRWDQQHYRRQKQNWNYYSP